MDMEVLFKAYHSISVENKSVDEREINGAFDIIVQDMFDRILGNPAEKKYHTEHSRAVVASIIKDIVKINRNDETARDDYAGYADEIASRLLAAEVKAQEKVEHLKGIQKGSLIQALIRLEPDKLYYLIAKVEHSKYVDEEILELKGGFNPEENKIWKTTIFTCANRDTGIEVSQARVYLNNSAVYWTKDFLELTENRTDESNTKDAWRAIEGVLKSNLKASKPNDYFILRNAVIAYFRRPINIDYDVMISDIFKEYEPINSTEDEMEELKKKLLALPRDNNFDTNFKSKPKEVRARIKSTHKVNNDIELIIREGLEGDKKDYNKKIYSHVTPKGEKQIIIQATELETFNMFNIKNDQDEE